MRVWVADGALEVRWALRPVPREQPGLSLVGEAAEAAEPVSRAQALQPDLIVQERELSGCPAEELLLPLYGLGLASIVLSRGPGRREAAQAAGAPTLVSKAGVPERASAALRRWAHA